MGSRLGCGLGSVGQHAHRAGRSARPATGRMILVMTSEPTGTSEPARRAPASVLVIFGASGDLTARKLLPALERLAAEGALPQETALVGVARTAMTDEEFADYCRTAVPGDGNGRWKALTASARYVSGGYDDPDT